MKNRSTFYLFIAALIVLDAVLLRSSNLLGKIGLIIYKYHYLRTFPKALLTVFLVVGGAVLICEVIRYLQKQETLKRSTARVFLLAFGLIAIGMLVKTGIDFTTWSYSHTGLRFRIGAYLLPAILAVVFFYTYFTIPKAHVPFPESPAMKENNEADVISRS